MPNPATKPKRKPVRAHRSAGPLTLRQTADAEGRTHTEYLRGTLLLARILSMASIRTLPSSHYAPLSTDDGQMLEALA